MKIAQKDHVGSIDTQMRARSMNDATSICLHLRAHKSTGSPATPTGADFRISELQEALLQGVVPIATGRASLTGLRMAP